jgi:hypothetical protein
MAYPAGGYGPGGNYGSGGYYPPPQPGQGFEFGWISEAWALFQANAGSWIIVQLAVFVLLLALEAVFLGHYFLSMFQNPTAFRGPNGQTMMLRQPSYWAFFVISSVAGQVVNGGLYRMAYLSARGQPVSPVDAVSLGSSFLNLMAYGLLLLPLQVAILMTSGNWPLYFGALILNGLVQSFLLFAPLVIIAEEANPLAAIARSASLIGRQWPTAVLFAIVLMLVVGVGACACGFGMLATYPLLFLSLAVGYLRLTGQGGPGISLGYVPQPYSPPGAWPPPPGPQAQQPPYGQPPTGPSFGQPPSPWPDAPPDRPDGTT